MKQFLFALLLVLMASFVVVNPVSAEENEVEQEQLQKLTQEFEVKCESGSYGDQNCYVTGKQEGEQSQKQRVKILGVSDEAYHKPVDAGLDANSMMVVAGILIAGSLAGAYQLRRIRS